jgi:hypothetical protein
MKRIIYKFWGIGLIVILLSSLFVAAATPASASDLAWSNQSIPSAPSNQLAAGIDAAMIKVAPNGDLFAVDPATAVVYKSSNGRTWTASTAVQDAAAALASIVDMAISPSYATDSTVFLLANQNTNIAPAQVYISTNGGASFAVLGGSIAGMLGTSIDVAPNYASGVGEVMVGTVDGTGAAGSPYGDVYIWGRGGVLNWIAQGIGTDTVTVTAGGAGITGGDATDDVFNVTYVDQGGAASAGTITIPAAGLGAGGTVALALAAGDTGVRNVTAIVADPAQVPAVDCGANTETLTFAGDTFLVNMGVFTFGVAPPAGVFVPGDTSGQDVTSVAFSPAYPIDATIAAVGSTAVAATGTTVNFKVSTLTWNLTIGRTVLNAAIADWNAAAAGVTASDMAFPSDFNGSLATQRTLFASVRAAIAATQSNIYRVSGGTASTALNPNTTDAGGTDRGYTSIVYYGDTLEGTLYAGYYSAAAGVTAQVRRCADTRATVPIWRAATNPPTGTSIATSELTYLALANDFATSNRIYAGTRGNYSALSISDDGGVNFYQAGLIDTTVNNILDFQAASATELWMVTEDTGAADPERVWKSTDGGASWYSVLAFATVADTAIIRPSPNYATDATVYFAETGAGATIRLSVNSGSSWDPRISSVNIADIAVKDQYSIYVANSTAAAGTVVTSANGGWVWTAPVVARAAATLNDIKLDLGTGDILVSTTAGRVVRSINNAVSFSSVGAAVGAGGAVVAAFDADYANNSTVYAVEVGANVNRFVIGTDTAWVQIDDAAATNTCVTANDLIVAPDGTLYVSDADAAGAGATVGGIMRTLTPTAPITAVGASFERVTTGDGLTAADILTGMTMAQGSNVLWAINNATAPVTVRTYADTMSAGAAAPTLVSPENGAINTAATSVTLTWGDVTGALTYRYQYDTRSDFRSGAAVAANVNDPVVTSGRLANLTAGITYYWRVRVNTPAIGPWSETYSFLNQLTDVAPNAPAIQSPQEGGTGPGGWNASLTPTFQWQAVPGATNFEFQLASDVDMTNLIVDATGANALGAVTSYKLTTPLDYNTTYYWKVRAVSATSNTAWSNVTAFTTMAEPAKAPEPTPPVEIKEVPAPVIEITEPAPLPDIVLQPPAEEKIAPAYIWAIIIIGAVLVIAVIVLIVRTRRSV